MYRCTLSDNARTSGRENLSRNHGDLSMNLHLNRPDHATNLANLARGRTQTELCERRRP